MATIKRRGNSYLIRCYDGYDQNGRQVEQTLTWPIPTGMTKKRAEKEARHQAELFEERIRKGLITDQKSMKFSAFAELWFSDYAETQPRPRTIAGYKALMQRIYPFFGHLYIDKIRPAHLMQFYRKLSQTEKAVTYHCNYDLKQIIKDAGYKSMAQFSEKHGIAARSVASAASGNNVSAENAAKIAKGLNKSLLDVFNPSSTEEYLSANTVGKYHRVLSSMFQTAVEWQFIVANPCERVSPPKVRKSEDILNPSKAKMKRHA